MSKVGNMGIYLKFGTDDSFRLWVPRYEYKYHQQGPCTCGGKATGLPDDSCLHSDWCDCKIKDQTDVFYMGIYTVTLK